MSKFVNYKSIDSRYSVIVAYLKTGAFKKAIDELGLEIRNNNDVFYLDHLFALKAKAHMAIEEYKEAIEAYTKSLEHDWKNCETLNDRGVAYSKIGEYQKACDDFGSIFLISEKYDNAYLNMAKVLDDMGESEKAIAYLKAAAEKRIDRAIERLANRGIEYQTKAMMESSEKSGKNYDWVAWFEKGRVLRDLYRDRININFNEEILDCFDRALKISPGNEVVLFEKAKILARPEDALEIFELLYSKNDSNIELMLEIVSILGNKNEYARAIEILEKVLLLDPNNEDANYKIKYFKEFL